MAGNDDFGIAHDKLGMFVGPKFITPNDDEPDEHESKSPKHQIQQLPNPTSPRESPKTMYRGKSNKKKQRKKQSGKKGPIDQEHSEYETSTRSGKRNNNTNNNNHKNNHNNNDNNNNNNNNNNALSTVPVTPKDALTLNLSNGASPVVSAIVSADEWNTTKAEMLLLKYRVQYEARETMHKQAAMYWNSIYMGLAIPNTFFNYLFGPSLLAVTVIGTNLPTWILITIALLLTIGAVLMTLLMGLKPIQKSEKHNLSSAACQRIRALVDGELSFTSHLLPYRDFLTNLRNMVEEQERTALLIPQHIESRWIKLQRDAIESEVRIRELHANFSLVTSIDSVTTKTKPNP